MVYNPRDLITTLQYPRSVSSATLIVAMNEDEETRDVENCVVVLESWPKKIFD